MQRRTGNDEASSSRASRLLGKRTALVLCGSVATWFMVSSVAQLVTGVFSRGVVPLAQGPTDSPERLCAEGVRRAAALEPGSPPDSLEGVQGDLAACSQTSAGLDALAALERLQKAKEQLGQRDPASVASLRFELSAHLPAEMR
jgi:hypothetical protein